MLDRDAGGSGEHHLYRPSDGFPIAEGDLSDRPGQSLYGLAVMLTLGKNTIEDPPVAAPDRKTHSVNPSDGLAIPPGSRWYMIVARATRL